MMMSTRFNYNNPYNYVIRRSPFQFHEVVSLGAKESSDDKTILSSALPWVAIATLIVATVDVLMLTLIYIGTSTSNATTNQALCPCQAVSGNSVLFPYGDEVGDYTDEGRTSVRHYLPDTFQCNPLGLNWEYRDTLLEAFIDEGRFEVGCDSGNSRSTVRLIGFQSIDQPSPANGSYFYHRKASEKENALFSCFIPDFKAVEVHVFTWISATINNYNETVGSFQVAYLVAEDSTAYLIVNYGDDFVGIPGENRLLYFKNTFQREFEDHLTADDLRGKREIILFSEDVYGTKLPRTEEQKSGPCPET